MTLCPTCGNALASSPEPARDRAERRVAELEAAGLHTLGDIERAQSSGERANDWRDDPSADERWNAGLDYGQTQLCKLLGVDPDKVSWDAATETLDGDVRAVIGNILTAAYGDNWRAALARPQADDGWRPTGHVSIAHDGFSGDIIGHYETREGKRGVVVQQDGTRVVHVYGEKWLLPSAPATGGGE